MLTKRTFGVRNACGLLSSGKHEASDALFWLHTVNEDATPLDSDLSLLAADEQDKNGSRIISIRKSIRYMIPLDAQP